MCDQGEVRLPAASGQGLKSGEGRWITKDGLAPRTESSGAVQNAQNELEVEGGHRPEKILWLRLSRVVAVSGLRDKGVPGSTAGCVVTLPTATMIIIISRPATPGIVTTLPLPPMISSRARNSGGVVSTPPTTTIIIISSSRCSEEARRAERAARRTKC